MTRDHQNNQRSKRNCHSVTHVTDSFTSLDELFEELRALIGRGNQQHDDHVEAWYEFEERAAIMEFDGGIERVDADQVAFLIIARVDYTGIA
ncbi:MAG: hypothetical protein AAF583_07515 [Pseudomonadota bacterium]